MTNTRYIIKKAGRTIHTCTGCIEALREANQLTYDRSVTLEIHRNGRDTITLDSGAIAREYDQFAN